MVPPLFLSRRRSSDQTKSDSNYYSFYNIKKTKLSARYPFLPKKQIERKIKHLWERASAEKRATLCLKSSWYEFFHRRMVLQVFLRENHICQFF